MKKPYRINFGAIPLAIAVFVILATVAVFIWHKYPLTQLPDSAKRSGRFLTTGSTLHSFPIELLPGKVAFSWSIGDTISPGETRRHEITVERTRKVSFACQYVPDLHLFVTDPRGAHFDSLSSKGDESCRFGRLEEIEGHVITSATFGNYPAPGKWVIEITAGNEAPRKSRYHLSTYYIEPEIDMSVFTDKEFYHKGDTIVVIAKILKGQTPLLDVDITAFAVNTENYPHRDTFPLFDDGTHGDSTPGDGIYSNIITDTQKGGNFHLSFKAEKYGPESFFRRGYAPVTEVGKHDQSPYTGQ